MPHRLAPVDLARFVEELLDLSGEAILPFFRTALAVGDKAPGGAFDPVTEADRAAELVIRARLRERFPDHGLRGEEFPDEAGASDYAWVIDPIDGTRAFVLGLPTWGTLVALTRAGSPVFGAMNQPFVGERFLGDGARAWRRGRDGAERRLLCRPCATLAEAHLATTDPRLFEGGRARAYARVESAARAARYGTDCYAYAMLAMGGIDLVVECGLKAHDVAALVPIVTGAGGVITTWEGAPAGAGGDVVAAGDPRLHAAALALLAAR